MILPRAVTAASLSLWFFVFTPLTVMAQTQQVPGGAPPIGAGGFPGYQKIDSKPGLSEGIGSFAGSELADNWPEHCVGGDEN
jgi:hypothetical protein